MHIQLDERLTSYMKEHHKENILITSMLCHTLGGSRLEVSARFIDAEETAALKADHFQIFPHPLGNVLIRRIPQHMEETVTLGLSKFFKRITVQGIYSA